jgi:hypothetical protein
MSMGLGGSLCKCRVKLEVGIEILLVRRCKPCRRHGDSVIYKDLSLFDALQYVTFLLAHTMGRGRLRFSLVGLPVVVDSCGTPGLSII